VIGDVWAVVEAGVIFAGACVLTVFIGGVVLAYKAAEDGRGFFPWGQRRRVERARASQEVAEHRVEEEMAELKYLALQPVRNRIAEATEKGETVQLKELLAGQKPGPEGEQARAEQWQE
jgi:hypothetical protein